MNIFSHRRNKKLNVVNKEPEPIDHVPEVAAVQNTEAPAVDTSSKKVLVISKVAEATKEPTDTPITTNVDATTKKPAVKKNRNIDSIDKWNHDMYDEQEQTRKTRNELFTSYGYDIREETEAPKARRHHKYG